MSTSLPDLHSEAVHRPGGFFNLNKDTKLRSINLEDLRVRNSEDQDELEREERRKRGLYGLSNSEKACFSRFTQPSLEAVRRATASKEERRRSKSTARSEASGGSGTASKSDASPKGQKRRLAILVNKQALTDLEMTEEAVHRILRVLFPSNPSAMARVGSSYRRQRGKSDKMLAFQMSACNTLPLLPSLDDGESLRTSPAMRRSFSSSFKTMRMERVESNGKEPKPERRPLQSPRTALDQSLKKIWPTADAQQVKKMGDLLKRELNLRSHVKQPGEQLPRRQPLYVTPDASGTKSNVREFVNSAKLESSLAGEVWDSNASGKDADRVVFHRMKNAAFLVSKIGEITEQINKERAEIRKLKSHRKQVTAPLNDECNFSLRSFRKRLLGKHQCLADAFRVLDLNVNQEWGAMFRGSGLATFREVQQRYRSIEAIFRESFEHMENEELNNDDDMRLSCDEFAEILEALDFSRRETSYLFWLADANGTKRLTLYEFFRGVKLFVPSCMVEALRLQGLARHARISDLFRHCGISWEKRLGPKAFAQLLQKLDIKCEDPHDAFDFLDVRSCGSISIREVVATLQNVMPGTKERSTLWECDRRAEKDVKNYLAPLHQTVTALKTTMKQDIEEDTPSLLERSSVCSRTERRRSSNRLAFNKTDLGFYLAQETFQRISSDAEAGSMSQPKATDYCGEKTVADLCGYLKSSSSTMELHGKLLSHHYSRTDWHQRHNRIKAVLARKI